MMLGGLTLFHFFAIALIMVWLATMLARTRCKDLFKSLTARRDVATHCTPVRFFEARRSPALKTCPNCAEQLSLAALICDACDYNFLSARPGRGQKMLPSPDPMARQVSDPKFASAAL
jgi:Uncharacterised protein family UPF0547